ncbi:MAG: trypsin-like peptidase domain-containing protein [Chloroflexi bacterium]|nr:trypsin-like peptidase domain-containing protein [Chloroflexota bacterium]
MIKRLMLALAAVALLVVGFALGTAVMSGLADSTRRAAQTLPVVAQQTTSRETPVLTTELEQLYADIYNRVSPSVVAIYVTFSDREGLIGGASGSGFVLDTDGHIVTNFHVVDNADTIEVNFVDGTRARGEVVGTDPDSDLAVLQVDVQAGLLQPVILGDSDALVIGQMTIAIGSPFGQRWTMTTGIVSAVDRRIQGLSNYSVGAVIQTDAAINPGNSGGPLFNLQGEVIGVNSQIVNDSFGIGFAVPSNLVRRVVTELIENGRVSYSFLGIEGRELTDLTLDFVEQFNVPANLRGVVVTSVFEGGPAQQAGLRGSTDDTLEIITAINGTPVLGFSSLVAYLATNTRPGDTVTLTVLRGGEARTVSVTLGTRPAR